MRCVHKRCRESSLRTGQRYFTRTIFFGIYSRSAPLITLISSIWHEHQRPGNFDYQFPCELHYVALISSQTFSMLRDKHRSRISKVWEDLLPDLPQCEGSLNLETYLNSYIWPKRKQCATAYFRNAFTLGHSTTQRAESWHKQLKGLKNMKTLQSLAQSIQLLVEKQKGKELEMNDWHLRLSPFLTSPILSTTKVVETTKSLKLSNFACSEISQNMFDAIKLSATILGNDFDHEIHFSLQLRKRNLQDINKYWSKLLLLHFIRTEHWKVMFPYLLFACSFHVIWIQLFKMPQQ